MNDTPGTPVSGDVAPSAKPAESGGGGAALDLLLLGMRLAVGMSLFAQGTTKWGWFGGTEPEGMSGLQAFLDILGYDSTTFSAWLLTGVEVTAGALLVVGLFTPLAAAGMIGIALNGIFVLNWSIGFANGWAPWIAFGMLAVAVAYFGPGRIALDGVTARIGSLRQWLSGVRAAALALVVGVGVGSLVITVLGPGFASEPDFPEFEPPPPPEEPFEG